MASAEPRLVSDNPHGQFLAIDELLDQDRLAIVGGHLLDDFDEPVVIVDEAGLANSLARTFAGRLDDHRQRQRSQAVEMVGQFAIDDHPIGRGQAGAADQLLGARFVERDGQRERIGTGVGNAQHFQESRHPCLARAPDAMPLGEVEHQIGPGAVEQPLDQRRAISQKLDFVPQRFQRGGQALDRLGGVELLLGVVGPAGKRLIGGGGANGKRQADFHGARP